MGLTIRRAEYIAKLLDWRADVVSDGDGGVADGGVAGLGVEPGGAALDGSEAAPA
jgi:hypothetical protein